MEQFITDIRKKYMAFVGAVSSVERKITWRQYEHFL
jgi:hypothetical protein